jgi:hypothetical protein
MWLISTYRGLEQGLNQPYHEPPRRIGLVLSTPILLFGPVLTSIHLAIFLPTPPKPVCSYAPFSPPPPPRHHTTRPRPFLAHPPSPRLHNTDPPNKSNLARRNEATCPRQPTSLVNQRDLDKDYLFLYFLDALRFF